MPLIPGATIGPYTVIAKTGEGGIGEVVKPATPSSTATWS